MRGNGDAVGGEGYPACRIFSVTRAGRLSHALRHPFYLISVFGSFAVCLRLPLLPPRTETAERTLATTDGRPSRDGALLTQRLQRRYHDLLWNPSVVNALHVVAPSR